MPQDFALIADVFHFLFQAKITYVVRPILPFGCESKVGHCGAIGTRDPVTLGGYGVELALKNMEYKAMDDSAVKKGLFFASYSIVAVCVLFWIYYWIAV